MMLAIGIDPGKKTGVAVWSVKDRRFELIETTDFWGAFKTIQAYAENNVVKLVIERPATKAVWHKGGSTTSVNVGSVLREADLFIEWCEKYGYSYQVVKPRGKVDQDRFKRLTGWQHRTSQHARDAALHVFGMQSLHL